DLTIEDQGRVRGPHALQLRTGSPSRVASAAFDQVLAMRYECRLVMAWFPDQQLRQVQRVHVGPLFEVLRASLGGRDVAIKRYGATPQWDAALVSVWQHDDPTNVFYHRHLGWTNQELPPGPSHF